MHKKKRYSSFTYLGLIKNILGFYNPKKHEKGNVLFQLLKVLQELPEGNINDFSRLCINNKKLSYALNLELKSDFYFDIEGDRPLPFKFIFDVFGFFLKSNNEFFQQFHQKQMLLEECIILGKYEDSILILDSIDEEFGRSIWAIDARMSVYSKFNKVDELTSFKKSLDGDSISHIVSLLYSKYTSISLNLFYKQILANLLKEYRNNDRGRYADLISLFLIPSEIDTGFDFSELILFSQRISPIDRLLIYKKVAIEASVNDNLIRERWYQPLMSFVDNIKSFLPDSFWGNISNFNQSDFAIRTDSNLIELITAYSKGNYDQTIKLCEEQLSRQPRELSVLDIYSRSLVYTKKIDTLESKETDLYNVHNVFLMSLAALHNATDDYEFVCETIETHLFKYLNFDFTYSFKPLYLAAYPFIKSERLVRASKELYCSSFYVSPKYLSRILNSKEKFFSTSFEELNENLSIHDFSTSRQIRLNIETEIKKDRDLVSIDNVNHWLESLSETGDVLESEYQYLWVTCKLREPNVGQVIQQISQYCIENLANVILFPLVQIVELLDDSHEQYEGDLSSVICHYFNFRVNDFDSKELTSERFEDYLTYHGVTKPSQIAEKWEELDSEKLFFLSQISSPEIMSIIVEIDTTQALLIERLKILQLLINKFNIKDEKLLLEIRSIYDDLFVERLAKHHANNKITIDVNGIRKSRKSEYQSFFEQIDFFKNFDDDILLEFFEDDKEQGTTKRESAIIHFYGKVYHDVIEDFVFNEDFGLIRYLNSEVRHGVMPNQIRSVFEAYNLVTFLEEDNKYESNVYWRKAYEMSSLEPLLDFIDSHLEWFSTEVDELIGVANGWLIPTKDKNDRNVAFNLSYDLNKLTEFKEFVSVADSTDNLIELCEEFVWQQLDNCFRIMRSLLNKELKTKFNELFEQLISRLNDNDEKIELNQLSEVIGEARNKVTEEITNIEGWFCRPKKSRIGTASTADVLKVSIGSLKGIFDPREINFNKNLSNILFELNEEQALGLTRALVTAYQNALIHGVNKDNVDIILSSYTEGNMIRIVISNYITAKKVKEINDKNIMSKVKEYKKSEAKDLLTTIGGTGLYKIFRYLVDSFELSLFTVEVEDKKFNQVIEITFK